ncbi:hypothetical protein [Leptospirillum ferrooxidans]|uniref:hypothetical protein n=1 Tax=Leptospirillum ferrooxidans TaxID=180 RepID=UPI0002E6B564|nr:hypothetical protein [Leptospirillum ferrooxidans]
MSKKEVWLIRNGSMGQQQGMDRNDGVCGPRRSGPLDVPLMVRLTTKDMTRSIRGKKSRGTT